MYTRVQVTSAIFHVVLVQFALQMDLNHSESLTFNPQTSRPGAKPHAMKCCRPCQRLRCQKLRTSPLSRSLDHGENCTAKKLFITSVANSIRKRTHMCISWCFIWHVDIYIYTTRINDNIYNMCLCVSENVTRHLGNMNALVWHPWTSQQTAACNPIPRILHTPPRTQLGSYEKLILQGWVSIHGHLLHG